MNTLDLKKYLAERKALVEAAMDVRLPAVDAEPSQIHDAMRYAALSEGKRLRPILTVAVGELAGHRPDDVMDAACAIECAHAASLILDDLPCMDDAFTRRERPCTHLEYGEATALLAAMALLSLAFDLVARNEAAMSRNGALPPAASQLASAIGSSGLVYGQHLDLHFTGAAPSIEELECIHQNKAGALFLAAICLPAQILGCSFAQERALEEYGEKVGLAFQITDDLLDAAEPDEDMGKTTFATHLGIAGAEERVQILIEEAVNALEGFGEAAEPLRQLAQYVRSRNR